MDVSAGNSTPHIKVNFTSPLEPQCWDLTSGIPVYTLAGFSVFVIGLPLNAWVLKLMVRGGRRLVDIDIFSFNLTAMVTFYCLLYPVCWCSQYFCYKALILTMTFTSGFILAGQPLFQCCICVERYLAVVHPFIYLKYKPVRYRATCSGAVWLLAVGFGGLTQFTYPFFPVYPFSAIFVAVLAVDLYCSFSILKGLMQPGPGEGDREGMNFMKKRAFVTMSIILAMMLVNYIPLPLVVTLTVQGLIPANAANTSTIITFSLFLSSAFVQPLIYLAKADKLKCLKLCRESLEKNRN